MSPADLLLDAAFGAVYWFGEWVPRLPASVMGLASDLETKAGQLFENVPYVGLVPWTTINTVALVVPAVWVVSRIISVGRSAAALVRSRGISTS